MSAPTSRDICAFLGGTIDADDDAFAVDRIDNAGTFADDDGAGIAGSDPLHARADVGRFGAQQRDGLALHVRTHERAVGVVVFEERDERGGHRNKLFRG